MAKVTIAGGSYIITSTVPMADLERVKRYRPSALTITDPETKEALFQVDIGSNSVSDYGVCFGGVSNSEAKLATATLPFPQDVEDAKTYVQDKLGLVLVSLKKVEVETDKVLEEIRTGLGAIADDITVIT